jgi:drug/metabolite transporter (DMT)-like permease
LQPPLSSGVPAAFSSSGTICQAWSCRSSDQCLPCWVVAWFTRREGFAINGVTVAASFLYAALVILFVSATKQTTAANAIFLQYTSPMYLLIFEPLVYKEKFRSRDLMTVLVCLGGMTLFFVGQLRRKTSRATVWRWLLVYVSPPTSCYSGIRRLDRLTERRR